MRKIVALLLVLLVISSMPVCAIAFGAPGYGDAESGDSGPAVAAGEKKDFMVPETTDTSWQTEETTIPAEEPTEIAVTPDVAEVEAASSQETVRPNVPAEKVEEHSEEGFGKRLFFQKTEQTELWMLIVPAIGAAAALAALYILRKKSGK